MKVRSVQKRCQLINKAGLYLGYPQCCIDYFIGSQIEGFQKDPIQIEMSYIDGEPTGFIPCLSCAERIKRGEIELQDLIKDRKLKAPFPIESEDFRELVKPLL